MTLEIMRASMGRLLDEILHHTYPYLTEEQVESVLKDYLALGCDYIAEAGGRLFDGLEATLKTLSAQFPFYRQQLPGRLYRGLFPGARPAALFKDYEHPGRTGKPEGGEQPPAGGLQPFAAPGLCRRHYGRRECSS